MVIPTSGKELTLSWVYVRRLPGNAFSLRRKGTDPSAVLLVGIFSQRQRCAFLDTSTRAIHSSVVYAFLLARFLFFSFPLPHLSPIPVSHRRATTLTGRDLSELSWIPTAEAPDLCRE
ncbi:hypothetical protein MRX96_021446 [Rhipicephalus microplus]